MKRELGGFSTSELEQANYKISYKSTNISTSTFDLHDFILKKKAWKYLREYLTILQIYNT